MYILRRCLHADKNDFFFFLSQFLGALRSEYNLPSRRTGRSAQAFCQQFQFGLGVNHRMKDLIQLVCRNPHQGFPFTDQPLVHHIDRHFDGRGSRAFASPRLQQKQFLVFNSELQVLHVFVMVFQFLVNLYQGLIRLRHILLQLFDRVRRPDSRNDILPLGIDHIFPIEFLFPRRRVPGKRNTGRGSISHIAKHHGLNRDRRTPFVRDAIQPSVCSRPFRIPGIEYRLNRHAQLLYRVFRKFFLSGAHYQGLELLDERFQLVQGKFRIEFDFAF